MAARRARRRRQPAPGRRLPGQEDRRWRGHQQPSKRCAILPWGLRLGASRLHLEQTSQSIEHRLAPGSVLEALQPSPPAADRTANLREILAADIDRAALAVGAEVGRIGRGHGRDHGTGDATEGCEDRQPCDRIMPGILSTWKLPRRRETNRAVRWGEYGRFVRLCRYQRHRVRSSGLAPPRPGENRRRRGRWQGRYDLNYRFPLFSGEFIILRRFRGGHCIRRICRALNTSSRLTTDNNPRPSSAFSSSVKRSPSNRPP